MKKYARKSRIIHPHPENMVQIVQVIQITTITAVKDLHRE